MALIRALEFLKLPHKRQFSDLYARQFVPICLRALLGPAHLPAVRALLEDMDLDRRVWPGAMTDDYDSPSPRDWLVADQVL
jgi:hypothetical protein